MTRVIIEGYPHRPGGHCGSGALRDLLHWAGLGWDGPPSEPLVFGLGGGLSFFYLRSAGLQPPVYLLGRNGGMELDFCRRLGIDVECRQTEDPDEGWRWLADELHAGRPVMAWADIAELPYLRVQLANTRHDVVVIGYDDETGMAHVVDNDRDEVQHVPFEALVRARNSSAFPGPNRNAIFPMRFPPELPDLLTAARAAARAAVSSLRKDEDRLIDVSLFPPGSVVGGGLDGVIRFVDDLARWPEELDAADLDSALRALPVFVEKAGTGGGFFRRLQAGFCQEVADRTGDRAFREAGKAYLACAEAWSALGRVAGRTGGPDPDELRTAAARLPDSEVEAAVALEDAAMGGPRGV